MENKVYYLCGPDGSGKTTYTAEIEFLFKLKNISYRHIWLRSPKITSKPLMLLGRTLGLTKYTVINGVKYGKHEFYRSQFFSFVFPYLQYIDFILKWNQLKKNIRKDEVLLFDRFAIDTLVDLMVDTNRMDLPNAKIGKKFIDIIPANSSILMMHVDEQVIRQRKEDTLFDEHLSKKIEAFTLIAKNMNLKIIDNTRSYELVKNEVIKSFNLD